MQSLIRNNKPHAATEHNCSSRITYGSGHSWVYMCELSGGFWNRPGQLSVCVCMYVFFCLSVCLYFALLFGRLCSYGCPWCSTGGSGSPYCSQNMMSSNHGFSHGQPPSDQMCSGDGKPASRPPPGVNMLPSDSADLPCWMASDCETT